MGLLEGKKILITGVLTDASLAYGVAKVAQEQGAEIILTGAGRGLRLTERTARKLHTPCEVFEFDVTQPDQADALHDALKEEWGSLDGALHSIGFAPETVLGDDFMKGEWDDVKVALEISAYSLKVLASATAPLMEEGGSLVGFTFDASFAWPAYNWMGVAKAALEATNRYLARSLGAQGIRCNLVAAGPIRTMAAKSIPGFTSFEDVWHERAPLGWNVSDATVGAETTVAMLSDWFRGTTGSIIHVDGGYHSVGA